MDFIGDDFIGDGLEVMVTTGVIRSAKLHSNHHH